MESIGSILRSRMKVIRAIHEAQQTIGADNPNVAVLLAMIQLCLLEADEHDLAKWMSFYMMKKLEVEAGPELMQKLKEQMANMSPEEIKEKAESALDMINQQREELLTKIEKGKD